MTLLFRQGATVSAVATDRITRPDVAAYFAAQPAEATGGARGLEEAGFACEIVNESLAAGGEWEIVLRLDCAGLACELPTGHSLRP